MQNNKAKEPAPSEAVTSSKQNYSKGNDSTERAKCQEAITAALDTLDVIYCALSEKEQSIWNTGITYKRLLDVQQMTEESNHDRN